MGKYNMTEIRSPQLLQAFPFSVSKASHYLLQSFLQAIHIILHL